MPVFCLQCPQCFKTYSKLLKEKIEIDQEKCTTCSSFLERKLSEFSSQSTEVIDNGIMIRQVEKLINAEELLQERSKHHEQLLNPLEIL